MAGVLRVDVVSAQNLAPAVMGSLLKWTSNYSNPYVVVSLATQQFVTTSQNQTLNPTWKELGELHVPLPSEQEVVQTMGLLSANASSTKLSADQYALAAKKLGPSSGYPVKPASGARRQYQACSPELVVQVFHRNEDGKAAAASSAPPAPEAPQDKLLGSVVVPLLPCLMATSSSHRAWYALADEDHRDAGQIQLALQFDVGGLAPIKGDMIRLAGFGGMEYYSKVVPPGVRLEVVETYQDQVLAMYKSIEGWTLSFEFHRNLVHVVHRPSILQEASSQLQGQLTRVRESRLLQRAQRLWLAVPATRRQQALQTYQFTVFSGALLYETLSLGVHEALQHGVRSGVVACRANGTDAFGKVKSEFVRIYWSSSGTGARGGGGWFYEDTDEPVDCGPKRARGKIYTAFTVEDIEAQERAREREARLGVVGISGYGDFDDEDDAFANADDDDEEDNDADACPEQLICPITGCPMVDPVVAADGHTYERAAIEHWFSTSDISPLTGMHIPTTQVFPNFTLRKLSEEFQNARRRSPTSRSRRH